MGLRVVERPVVWHANKKKCKTGNGKSDLHLDVRRDRLNLGNCVRPQLLRVGLHQPETVYCQVEAVGYVAEVGTEAVEAVTNFLSKLHL